MSLNYVGTCNVCIFKINLVFSFLKLIAWLKPECMMLGWSKAHPSWWSSSSQTCCWTCCSKGRWIFLRNIFSLLLVNCVKETSWRVVYSESCFSKLVTRQPDSPFVYWVLVVGAYLICVFGGIHWNVCIVKIRTISKNFCLCWHEYPAGQLEFQHGQQREHSEELFLYFLFLDLLLEFLQ